jgi:DNA replication and repair protein RecF
VLIEHLFAVEKEKVDLLLSLTIENLRNIRQLSLDIEGKTLVVLTGGNGAGKTTILEGIYLLARSRSFRSRRAGSLTTNGQRSTLIKAAYVNANLRRTTLQVRRDPAGMWQTARRKRDAPPASLSVKLVGENPQALLESEPSLRRRFLDWNVFHVEPMYWGLCRSLNRIVAQRNAFIRSGRIPSNIWDRQFVALAEQVTTLRSAFFSAWVNEFADLARIFPFLTNARLTFDRGWSPDCDLATVLEQNRAREIACGYTVEGPLRAKFDVLNDGRRQSFSRGQAKVVVCLLQLAADAVIRRKCGPVSVWLVDDLEAELDPAVARELWTLILSTGSQVFATGVTTPGGLDDCLSNHQSCVFHVEHGRLLP